MTRSKASKERRKHTRRKQDRDVRQVVNALAAEESPSLAFFDQFIEETRKLGEQMGRSLNDSIVASYKSYGKWGHLDETVQATKSEEEEESDST